MFDWNVRMLFLTTCSSIRLIFVRSPVILGTLFPAHNHRKYKYAWCEHEATTANHIKCLLDSFMFSKHHYIPWSISSFLILSYSHSFSLEISFSVYFFLFNIFLQGYYSTANSTKPNGKCLPGIYTDYLSHYEINLWWISCLI